MLSKLFSWSGMIVLLLAIPVSAEDQQLRMETPVAEIDYLSGKPDIARGGQVIEERIRFGFPLYNLDQVRVGGDDMAEFGLTDGIVPGIEGAIRIEPSSVLSFYGNEHEANIHLLRGSCRGSITELPRRQKLTVHTADADIHVRGTDFTIDTFPPDTYLIVTEDGRVEVAAETADDDSEREIIVSTPGHAVEYTRVNGFRRVIFEIGTEDDFRRRWRDQRQKRLREKLDATLSEIEEEYRQQRERFRKSYAELVEYQQIFDQWIVADRQRNFADKAEQAEQRRQVADPLTQAAESLLDFEHTYHQTAALRDFADDMCSEKVLPEFGRDAQLLQRRMDMVRYYMYLFAQRNNKVLPLSN